MELTPLGSTPWGEVPVTKVRSTARLGPLQPHLAPLSSLSFPLGHSGISSVLPSCQALLLLSGLHTDSPWHGVLFAWLCSFQLTWDFPFSGEASLTPRLGLILLLDVLIFPVSFNSQLVTLDLWSVFLTTLWVSMKTGMESVFFFSALPWVWLIIDSINMGKQKSLEVTSLDWISFLTLDYPSFFFPASMTSRFSLLVHLTFTHIIKTKQRRKAAKEKQIFFWHNKQVFKGWKIFFKGKTGELVKMLL